MFGPEDDCPTGAAALDAADPLREFRSEFELPCGPAGEERLYFAGHSLGPMPKGTRAALQRELDDWSIYGVEGHLQARRPWVNYQECVADSFARLVGASLAEVVAMNTLTVNLHLMMVSFYRPTRTRFKILIENNTFPSDKYAVDSQARFHGFDPALAVIQTRPGEDGMSVDPMELLAQIDELGDSLALVLLGQCNYLSGQAFDVPAIVQRAKSKGALVGLNLAHGAGNLLLRLHDWEVDFAVWCSYKYLNAGPGGIAGAFVHQRHLGKKGLPRFEGWWGTDKRTRFEMAPNFSPMGSAEVWQLSNPPIFQLAALRSSMDIFDRAQMPRLQAKGKRLSAYLAWLLERKCGDFVKVMTPPERGSMLCLKVAGDPVRVLEQFRGHGVVADFRRPDILRVTPAPLYNGHQDVYRLVEIIREIAP